MHGSMDSSNIITSVYGIHLIKHRMYHQQYSSLFKNFIKDLPGSSNGATDREAMSG